MILILAEMSVPVVGDFTRQHLGGDLHYFFSGKSLYQLDKEVLNMKSLYIHLLTTASISARLFSGRANEND